MAASKLRLSLRWLAAITILSTLVASQDKSQQDLLWGPYRPNLYFGTRQRLPYGISTGLLWSRVDELQHVQDLFRYSCEQGDDMAGYGWEEYDARSGGRQSFHDVGNQVDITTDFAKIPGGQHGGNWGVRISGTPRPDAPAHLSTTVIFSVTREGDGILSATNPVDRTGHDGSINLTGQTINTGDFELEITTGPDTNAHPFIEHPSAEDKPLDKTMLSLIEVPGESLWQSKTIYFQLLKPEVDTLLAKYGEENLPPAARVFTIPNVQFNTSTSSANAAIIQKVFEGPFQFDVLFSSGSAPEKMTSESLTAALEKNKKDFEAKFSNKFKPSPAFSDKKYQPFAKALLSNLLGGIGYFHGPHVVDRSNAPEYEEENEGFWTAAEEARAAHPPKIEGPHELFTAVPSRPFFPRGFLWDEGFHLLLIEEWDVDLALEILKSWFRLADEDGWIAREQMLGIEARSKVPMQFQTQYPHFANPPTLFLVVEDLLDKIDSREISGAQKDTILETLKELYPTLKLHTSWYRKTQKGDLKSYDRRPSSKEAYRWRGRTPNHSFTSGLDDYPRAIPPHPGELHVDLMSWMGLLARSMKRIAGAVGESEDKTEFAKQESDILKNVDDLHWNKEAKIFCDVTIDEYEEDRQECHKGYVSIFPFLTGLLPADSPHLPGIFDLIHDPEELWSPHGIRSLSKKDLAYGTDENYWRSPVWININYLVLVNLLKVAQDKSSPYKQRASEIYSELRQNLVETVYKSWAETGFAWEQYNPDTGAGQRTKHFTGWTSLITKIISMPDLAGKKASSPPEHGEL